jgi:hypothetical protein
MTVIAIVLAALLGAIQAADQSQGRLTGQVVEQGGRTPIPNARVMVFSMARPQAGPPQMFETMTDAEGRFAFDNVSPGAYRVQGSKPGYAIQMFGTQDLIVEVLAGQTREGVSVSLSRGGAIAGHVTDASGEAEAEVQVMAMRRMSGGPGGRGMFVPAGPGAQTNDLGEYRLYGLAPGEYYVQASARPSMGPFNVASPRATIVVPTYYPSGRSTDSAQGITVAAGETIRDVDIHLMTAPAFQLSGTVVDESGAPVGGAMITVMPERGPMGGMPMMFGPPSVSRSNADGTFAVPNLPSGVYTIRGGFPITGGGANVGVVQGAIGAGSFTSWTSSGGGASVSYTTDGTDQTRVTIGDANVDGFKLIVRRR